MTHEEILNQMLYTMCPEGREGDVSYFRIDGHCNHYVIEAESLPDKKWKILSFKII